MNEFVNIFKKEFFKNYNLCITAIISLNFLLFPESLLQLLLVEAAAEDFEHLVDDEHRRGEGEHGQPFVLREGDDAEDCVEEWHVEDHAVEAEGGDRCQDEVGVDPWRHHKEGVILR